jgi:hypothetical protein
MTIALYACAYSAALAGTLAALAHTNPHNTQAATRRRHPSNRRNHP